MEKSFASISIARWCLRGVYPVLITSVLSACGGGGGGSNNGVPTASAGALIATEDQNPPQAGLLLASDPDSDPLTYQIVTNPAKGVVVVTNASTGAYTYQPNPNQNGFDSFTFKVNDGQADSNTATVTITITPVNDAPAASDDTASTLEDTPTVIDVLANDTDVDGDTLSVQSVTQGSDGSVTNNGTDVTYSPNTDFNGTDIFTYTVSDGNGGTDTATVTVTVDPVNDPPVVSGACTTTPQESLLEGDGIQDPKLQATDVDSPTLTFSLVSDGAKGNATVSPDGSYTYTPFAHPTPRGTDTFTFRVDDGDGGVVTAQQTVIIDQKIMPLGDSITTGQTDGAGAGQPPNAQRVGYRKPLWDSLFSSGYMLDFVGSANFGSGVPNFDFHSEGHEGCNAAEIAFGSTTCGDLSVDAVSSMLDAKPADIVLLHVGTNDYGSSGSLVADVESLLDEIDNWVGSASGNPVKVLVAKIIDTVPTRASQGKMPVPTFNTLVADMVTGKTFLNQVTAMTVDQYSALTYADARDFEEETLLPRLHPDTGAYGKMATVWHTALLPLLEKCP